METTTEKKTWVEEQSKKFDCNRKLLCAAMNISEEDMFWFVWEAGMKFLTDQCQDDQYGINTLKAESFYWNWWRNQWNLRDDQFVIKHELLNCGDPEELHFMRKGNLRLAYQYLHAGAMITDELSKGYEYIVSDVIKKEMREYYLTKHK